MATRGQRTSLLFFVALAAAPRAAHAQTEAPEVPDAVESPPEPAPARPAAPRAEAAPTEPRVAPAAESTLRREPVDARAPEWDVTPGARLDVDSGVSHGGPSTSLLVRRARLQATGWVGPFVYFSAAAEYATPPGQPSTFAPTDVFVAVAPLGPRLVLQAGQFDAPFTLENRTSDKYIDFMERSLTVRAFGIPTNKEQGFMLHGTNDARNYYYSASILNGDGQNFKNLDNSFDLMGRAWVAPASFLGEGPMHDITVGGSYWTGNRNFANPLANQTTPGGFKIFDASLPKLGMDTATLNQQGRQHTYAFEVNAPIAHKFGVRWEFVHKNQPLSAIDTTMGPTSIAAGLHLKGWSQYFEAWGWVFGDDRIIGEPGMQLPTRYKKFGVKPPQHGLMIAARLEFLDETLSADDAGGPVGLLTVKPNSYGKTKVTSFTLGANYWISKRFRLSGNWTLNDFGGDTNYVTCPASMMPDSCGGAKGLKGLGNAKTEQEFAFRFAIAL